MVVEDDTDERSTLAEVLAELGYHVEIAPDAGAYVAESSYFESDWQKSYWGSNYARLHAIKMKYDPAGLFFVHHGVGSEAWSADGFTKLAGR